MPKKNSSAVKCGDSLYYVEAKHRLLSILKTSRKIGTVKRHLLELSWPISEYDLNHISLGIKLCLFFKVESCLFEKEFCQTSQNFNSFCSFSQFYFHYFYLMSYWIKILWGFTKFFFKQILKFSAFYLEKQKSFIPKKNFFLAVPPRYIQKMALAVLIFQKVLT